MELNKSITAIKVKQWLNDWNSVPFGNLRKKPEPHFYVFSISANTLKKLSKVYPRKADENRNIEIGVQRKHDPERSAKIRQYVFGGFPWSDLSDAKRKSDEYSDLKMPGWLPTAIIANIIAPDTFRGGTKISKDECITISDTGDEIKLSLPSNTFNKDWTPDVPPIEIIDGQHRLWAFEQDEKLDGDFELPVVAFFDLDVSWQAYLFYTINIKPKKINASLAFDLYPILRVQDWLERSPDGAFVYKETRAQELVEVLWSMEESPWKDRINMLGERFDKDSDKPLPTITQSAFIRTLIATLIKTSTTKGLGGLYGATLRDGNLLFWNRTQQAAFLIFSWRKINSAIENSKAPWAENIRELYNAPNSDILKKEIQDLDPAFAARLSLISTDQGVRGFLHIINDMVYMLSETVNLNDIQTSDEIKEDTIAPEDVQRAINAFEDSKILKSYVEEICNSLTKFDWRTSSTPGLDRNERQKQMIYKGSSGYKEIRTELLKLLTLSENHQISANSEGLLNLLGYAK